MVIGVIAGSGFYQFPELGSQNIQTFESSYGEDVTFLNGKLDDVDVIFLPRHGFKHSLAPHLINYRANIDALSRLGVKKVISVNTVGGLSDNMSPGIFVIPDQIIDYTCGRGHTFFEVGEVEHVDFTFPFCPSLRKKIGLAFDADNCPVIMGATYGCTQGPRLETAAEIKRMQRDGCDVVGMTMMPEASLAREKNLDYASICLCVNWAAGISNSVIDVKEMMSITQNSIHKIREIIHRLVKLI